MVVSTTFNVGDLSPYVEDALEDSSDLKSNPLEEGEVDIVACTKEFQGVNMNQENQEQPTLANQIQALFSFPSSQTSTVLGVLLEMIPWSLLDEAYFVGLPKLSNFAGTNHFWPMSKAFFSKDPNGQLAQSQLISARFSILARFDHFDLI